MAITSTHQLHLKPFRTKAVPNVASAVITKTITSITAATVSNPAFCQFSWRRPQEAISIPRMMPVASPMPKFIGQDGVLGLFDSGIGLGVVIIL
jgi:hypothetical protein